jgi:hypothetical protein
LLLKDELIGRREVRDLGLAGGAVCGGVLFVVEAWREPVKD